MDLKLLRESLIKSCEGIIEQRILNAEKAMESFQIAANTETKSSAGDKHETERAMMHLEKEKTARQLSQSLQLKRAIYQLRDYASDGKVHFGSVVITSQGNFFIAISVGKVTLDLVEYMVVSPTTPLGEILNEKKKGDKVIFNGKELELIEVY